MTTTDLQQHEHLTQPLQHHHIRQHLHASPPQTHTPLYHYPQHQTQAALYPHHHHLKMDADFWQQARGGPFGVHSGLAANHMHHSQMAATHMQNQQQEQPQHHLAEHPSPAPPQHLTQTSTGNTHDDLTAMTEQQHLHQQQHLHNEQLQQQHQQHQQPHHTHLTPLGTEQSHHLLFNAAAAAAAAAHLSGVVKSNELSSTTINNDDDKIISNNNNTNNNNNNNCNTEQNIITKQEPQATNGSNSNGGSGVYSGTTANNNPHNQVSEQQQMHHSHSHLQHRQQQPQALKFAQGNVPSSRTLPLETLQQQIQHQMQQQKHPNDSLRIINSNTTNNPENHSYHQQHLTTQHQQQLSAAATESSSLDRQQQVLAVTATSTKPLAASSPLQLTSLAHHQTPASSPQPSLTSPSGGSSTPDLKFNNDHNNKLPQDLQLQLSRSNSAAAISERTLEECWSTLQRLFMHKNAMQQIQQQIPRTGLGPAVAGGIGAESKPHQCQQCMKSFSSNHQLVQHIRVHTGEKPYKCSYCDRRFKQLSHVQQHTRLHTGERPYKCHMPECGRAFIQLSNLQQHLRNHDAQVERAKSRPFHCNICGKGFATESSLRTHTSKELQLHLGVLQQHAALIGGPNATSCPICHKLFLGTDALMEHMKHVHKEKTSQSNNNPFVDSICNSAGNNLSNAGSTSCLQSSGASSSNDPYSAKRRTANHPCPVCGKHYVNEGSLRKHLACHAEASQLTNSLRMWPCSVCQAVFTHENGLLTHMEHMRMDPKHQFAAQYVLSRAAAERRERDNILAATLAVSGGSGGPGIMPLLGEGGGGGSNSLCPSPSANSECSSTGRLSSSAASDAGSGINLLNNNNNNTNNNNNSHNNNNTNCNNSNSNLSLSNKLNDILRTTSNNANHPLSGQHNPHIHSHHSQPHNLSGHGYGGVASVDADLQNRMSLMAAASAAAAAVAATSNNTGVPGLTSPQRFGVDATHTSAGSAAVQAAVVNLAAAMRLNQTSGAATGSSNANMQQQQQQPPQSQNQSQSAGSQNHTNDRPITPVHQILPTDASTAVMNAMRDSMMRSSMMETTSQETSHHQLQQQQQQPPGHTTYSHSNNTNMNQQQNVGKSHQIPQQQQRHQSQPSQHLQLLHHQQNSTASGALQHLHQQHQHTANNPVQVPPPHSPEAALHMQQQAEAILRSHTEAAFRLAASVVQQQTPEISSSNNNNNSSEKIEQQQPHQQQTIRGVSINEDPTQQQKLNHTQNPQDISEAIRLQEHRLEQALRLHSDVRTFNFLNTSAAPQQQQQEQQPNNTANHAPPNTTNTDAGQQQQHHHAT